MWKLFTLRKIIPKKLVGVILPTVMHRIQKTNECWWCLQQLEAWLKRGPSRTMVFHLDSHAYPPTLLPIGIPTFLKMVVFTTQRENLGGGGKFSTCLFHFCWGTLPKHHTVPVTVHLLCWQLLGTKISLPVKNSLCWNCHILRCTDLLLHLAVHGLRSSSVYRRWNTGTTPLYGMQRY